MSMSGFSVPHVTRLAECEAKEEDMTLDCVDSPATHKMEEFLTEAQGDDMPLGGMPEPLKSLINESSRSLQCDQAMIGLPCLAVCAGAIGNVVRACPKQGWSVPPVLWVVVVADSGSSKTPALSQALGPVRAINAGWNASHSGQGTPPTALVDDVTLEALLEIHSRNPRGLTVFVDELASLLASFTRYREGGDESRWLQFYNASPVQVDRKTGENRRIFVENGATSVVGGIQTDLLWDLMGDQRRKSGFAARILFAYPRRRQKRWSDDSLSDNVRAEYGKLITCLYDIPCPSTPYAIGLSEEAKQHFVEFYDHHNGECDQLTGDLKAAWSKLEEIPVRFALVLHVLKKVHAGDSLDLSCIDGETMQYAVELTEWCKRTTKRVYGRKVVQDDHKRSEKLLNFARAKGGKVTPREVAQGCKWIKDTEEAHQLLQQEVRRGNGGWEPSERGTPGRPTERFVVNETPEKPGG
jgi:hypothetical protein